jgi:hypothetical protein
VVSDHYEHSFHFLPSLATHHFLLPHVGTFPQEPALTGEGSLDTCFHKPLITSHSSQPHLPQLQFV